MQPFRLSAGLQDQPTLAKRRGSGQADALSGNCLGDINQLGTVGDKGGKQRRKKSIVGAAEHNLICACFQSGRKMLANLLGKSWIVEMQSFYFGCPARAGEYVNLYGSGVAFNQPSQSFAAGG